MHRRTLLAALSVGTALVAVPLPAHAAADHRVTATQVLEFPVQLSSASSSITELPGGVTYGWNDLRAPTRWGSRAANLRLQGSVNYIDGTGPLGGFVTITRSDGTKLALSVTGYATKRSTDGSTRTKFLGVVEVIGGSGPYAKARGTGSVSGFRKSAPGSPVKLTFTVTVERKTRR